MEFHLLTLLCSLVVALAVIGGIIWAVVYFARKPSQPQQMQYPPYSPEQQYPQQQSPRPQQYSSEPQQQMQYPSQDPRAQYPSQEPQDSPSQAMPPAPPAPPSAAPESPAGPGQG